MRLSSAETELKLALAPSVAESVLSVPVLKQSRAGRPKSQRLVTTYYETPEKDLARRGLTLRVRRDNDKRIQTVKAVGESGVADSRGEWEWPVESATPDLRLLKDAPIAKLLADVSEDRLEPIVVTDVVRTTQNLEVNGGLVEAALDLGSIVAGEAKQDIRELELELRQGTPGSLYRLALELNSAVPFDIGVESKAARGFRLREGLPPQATKPAAMRLKSDDPAIEALRAIIGETLGHLLTNQPAALAGDPEGVHRCGSRFAAFDRRCGFSRRILRRMRGACSRASFVAPVGRSARPATGMSFATKSCRMSPNPRRHETSLR
jgi:triphosphatase